MARRTRGQLQKVPRKYGWAWAARWREVAGGRLHQRTFPTKSEGNAHLDLMAAERAEREARGVTAEPDTLAGFEESFFSIYAPAHAVQEVRSARSRYKRMVGFFADTPLHEIDGADVEDYLADVARSNGRGKDSTKPSRPSTVNRHCSVLRAVIECATLRGRFTGPNPTATIRKRKEQETPPPYFEAGVITAFICDVPARHAPIVSVLADTGCRRGECCELEWRDVNFSAGRFGTITIRKSKAYKNRTIPLTPRASQVLQALAAERTEITLRGRAKVFVGYDTVGKRDNLSRVFKRAAGRLGITVCLHDLRHSFCSALVIALRPLSVVMYLAGHSSLKVTDRYSCHRPVGAEHDAILALAEARGQLSPSGAPTPFRVAR